MRALNVFNLPRGSICVVRNVAGEPIILAIQPQPSWKEYAGAFSLI